jgi:hypothetical protein
VKSPKRSNWTGRTSSDEGVVEALSRTPAALTTPRSAMPTSFLRCRSRSGSVAEAARALRGWRDTAPAAALLAEDAIATRAVPSLSGAEANPARSSFEGGACSCLQWSTSQCDVRMNDPVNASTADRRDRAQRGAKGQSAGASTDSGRSSLDLIDGPVAPLLAIRRESSEVTRKLIVQVRVWATRPRRCFASLERRLRRIARTLGNAAAGGVREDMSQVVGRSARGARWIRG